MRGSNYLVPVNANPAREADVLFQMVDTALVLAAMEGSGTKLNMVLLDACRNNPFGGRGLRAAEGGLAQMRAPEGTLISYATQPGNVALDGAGGNSPYTQALSQTIRKAGLDIFQTFNEIGLAVMQATGNAQQPWVSTSPIKGNFQFVATAAPMPAVPAVPSEAGEAWAATQNTTSVAVLQTFIDRFGNTFYGDMARARLQELKKHQAATLPVRPATPLSPVQTAAVAPPVRPSSPCGGPPPSVAVSVSSRAATPLSALEECALKPKDVFKECATCPEMVVVPAGRFTMGSPANEAGRSDREGPQHPVSIAQSLAVGRFAVTVDQFAAFVTDTRHDIGVDLPHSRRWQDRRKTGSLLARSRFLPNGLASGGMRQLRRCRSLPRMAVCQDRKNLQAADGGRMGICCACGDDDTVFLRRRREGAVPPWQRGRSGRQTQHPRSRSIGGVQRRPRLYGSGRNVPAEPIRPLRYARQRAPVVEDCVHAATQALLSTVRHG